MVELEVQDSHHSYRLKIIIPIEFGPMLIFSIFLYEHISCIPALLVYGISRIIDSPLTEMLLITFLHLDDETAPILALT